MPPASPAPEGGEEAFGAYHRERSRRWIRRAILAVLEVAVLAAAVGVILHVHGRPTRSTAQPGGVGPQPAAAPFSFPPPGVSIVPVAGAPSASVAEPVVQAVQRTLTSFYQAAFLTPPAGAAGGPPNPWNAFVPNLRARAQADASSLSLRKLTGTVSEVSVSKASLIIHVLLDDHGRPLSAIATVSFQATGTLNGTEPFVVNNQAHYLMAPVSGTWLIAGYPGANTAVTAPSVLFSPTPGVTESPGVTPSASGTTP